MRTGNATRIDYGTGHELAFVQLLYCGVSDNDGSSVFCQELTTLQARVGVFTADDAVINNVYSVFNK